MYPEGFPGDLLNPFDRSVILSCVRNSGDEEIFILIDLMLLEFDPGSYSPLAAVKYVSSLAALVVLLTGLELCLVGSFIDSLTIS